jgi:UDP-N-acetyl-D-glucosamine dehydrogenase
MQRASVSHIRNEALVNDMTHTVLADALKQKIECRTARLGVVGLGHVGLPLAMLYSRAGFRVTGFDVDSFKVASLNMGRSYIQRILPEEIQQLRENGFEATTHFGDVRSLDAVMICIPAPLREEQGADMRYIENTARALAPHLRAGQMIIIESTTYSGTTEEVLIPILEAGNQQFLRCYRDGEDEGRCFHVAYSPEREGPGNTSVDRPNVPKVIGSCSALTTELAASLYSTVFRRVIPVSSASTAEMTRLLEDIYRCVNIALVNELRLLCPRLGLDIRDIMDPAGTKPSGFQALHAGAQRIPLDPLYLSWKAKEVDSSPRFKTT